MDYALNAKGFGAWVKCVFAHIFPNPNLHLSSQILNLFKNPKKLWNLPMNFTQTEVGVRNVPITASTFILPVINFITGTWHYKLHWDKTEKNDNGRWLTKKYSKAGNSIVLCLCFVFQCISKYTSIDHNSLATSGRWLEIPWMDIQPQGSTLLYN